MDLIRGLTLLIDYLVNCCLANVKFSADLCTVLTWPPLCPKPQSLNSISRLERDEFRISSCNRTHERTVRIRKSIKLTTTFSLASIRPGSELIHSELFGTI